MSTSISTGYATGAQTAEGIGVAARKTAAFNALQKIYGDVAGDPEAALQTQEYGQREQTNPIAVDQAKANLTGTGLDNAGKTESNYLAQQVDPSKIEAAKQQVVSNQQGIDNTAIMDPIKQGDARETAAFNALAHPQLLQEQALKNTGLDLNNTKTAQDTTFAAQEHPLVMEQKKATIGLTGAQTANQYADASARRADAQKTLSEVGVEAARANAKAGTASGLVNPDGSIPYATQAKIGGAIDAVDNVRNLLPRMNSIGIIRKFNAEHVPGSPEAQAMAQLHTLTANLSQADLASLAQQGVKMGRITNMEMKLAGDSYGSTDIINGDPKTIATTLGAVRNVLSNFGTGAKPSDKSIGGRVGGSPSPTSRFVNNQVYTDASGTKSRYLNGQWVAP